MTLLISMFMFTLIGAASPGPVNIIAASSGASFGFRRTLPHILGASCSYTLIVLLVGLGLNHWLIMYPQLTESLVYIGSAFLLYMAYKIAVTPPSNNLVDSDKDITGQSSSFTQGALAQVLNPKAWLVSMSGVSLFVSSQSAAELYLLIFCVMSFALCMVGISTWAAIGQRIGQVLSTPRRQVAFNMMMGLLLSATVVLMLVSQWVG